MSLTASERIVAAALGLVEVQGLSNVTMKAVADAAGVSRQTLYNHFRDIDSIIAAVLELHTAEAISRLEEALAATPGSAAKLGQLVRHHVATVSHGQEVVLLAAGLAPPLQRQIAEHFAGYRAVIERLLVEGASDGSFRPDAGTLATIVHRVLDAGSEVVAEAGLPEAIAILADTVSRIVLRDI